jgi:Zn-dependent protease
VDPFAQRRRRKRLREKISSAFAAVAALVAKFFGAIKSFGLLILKFKLLTTSGTMLVSIAAYSLFWGWSFAAGFVLLLLVHEMGHVIQGRREGAKTTAPVFIPFLGAAIFRKGMPHDALAEARMGLAGPILGSVGAACVAVAGVLLNSDLLLALAYVGFLINLFNLLPVLPLDGGRAMAAMAPSMWFVGFAMVIGLAFVYPSPILLIVLLFGGLEFWQRWRQRRTRSIEQAAYYRVSPRNRAMVAVVYFGLIAALAFGMYQTHILATGGHSFASI